MSLETLVLNLESNLANMNLSNEKRKAPILELPIIQEIFANDADIYSADREIRHAILEVPNVYCGQFFDDEDFIYSKLNFDISDIENIFDEDYLAYIMKHNLKINNVDIDLNPKTIIAKIQYIFQYVNSYFTNLRYLRTIERLEYMPIDLIAWISNIVDTIRMLLDKKLFNYVKNETIPLIMFQEMVYGLELITCHIKLICNHYKAQGIDIMLEISKIEEKYFKKLMRLVNNLCVIIIYFYIYLSKLL